MNWEKKLKKSKSPLKNADLKACKAMSDYIREKDNWICITCGKPGNNKTIDAGHFFDRRYTDIRFDENNVHAQCTSCNRGFTIGVWDKYLDRMLKIYGQEMVDNLMVRRYIIKKRTVEELLDIERYYIEKLEQLRNERK